MVMGDRITPGTSKHVDKIKNTADTSPEGKNPQPAGDSNQPATNIERAGTAAKHRTRS